MEANQQKHSFTERLERCGRSLAKECSSKAKEKLILPTTTTDGFASSAAATPSVRAYLRTQ
jgi:hypothetical protein